MTEREFEALFTKPGVIDWKQIMRAAIAYGIIVVSILVATYALAKPVEPVSTTQAWYCHSKARDLWYPCRENPLWMKDL